MVGKGAANDAGPVLKVADDENNYRFRLESPLTWNQVHTTVEHQFGPGIPMKYRDDEGHNCTLDALTFADWMALHGSETTFHITLVRPVKPEEHLPAPKSLNKFQYSKYHGWCDFPAPQQRMLRLARAANERSVAISYDHGAKYGVDLKEMAQVNLLTGYVREIRCVPMGVVEDWAQEYSWEDNESTRNTRRRFR